MRRILLTFALGLSALSGCAPAPPEDCNAAAWQGLIGQNIAAVSLPADLHLRIIRPGDAVTMDYSPQRLNFRTDAEGRIVEITCG